MGHFSPQKKIIWGRYFDEASLQDRQVIVNGKNKAM